MGAGGRIARITAAVVAAVLVVPVVARSAGAGPGDLDPTFGGDGKVTTSIGLLHDVANDVAVQADGKIVAAGYTDNGSNLNMAVVRYDVDGTLDSSFSGDGVVSIGGFHGHDDVAYGVAIQADGKIVVAGYADDASGPDIAVARLTTTGSLDPTFSGDGRVTTTFGSAVVARDVAIQADGKIVVAGYVELGPQDDLALVRYTIAGVPDATFSGDGKLAIGGFFGFDDRAYAVFIQGNGSIVAAGYANNGADLDLALARVTSTGVLDVMFDGDGRVTTAIGAGSEVVYGVAIQNDGKIVATGYTDAGMDDDVVATRYTSTGALDASFSGDGKRTFSVGPDDDGGKSVVIDAAGRILVGGYAWINEGVGGFDVLVARLTPTGLLDGTFAGDGTLVIPFGDSDDVGNAVAFSRPTAYDLYAAGLTSDGVQFDVAVADVLLSTPFVTVDDVAVAEGDHGTTRATFTVTLGTPSGHDVTVSYATADRTATEGSDYVAVAGTLTFAPGQTSRTISVAIIGDTTVEPDEGFTLNLSDATGAQIRDGKGSGRIVNDD